MSNYIAMHPEDWAQVRAEIPRATSEQLTSINSLVVHVDEAVPRGKAYAATTLSKLLKFLEDLRGRA